MNFYITPAFYEHTINNFKTCVELSDLNVKNIWPHHKHVRLVEALRLEIIVEKIVFHKK